MAKFYLIIIVIVIILISWLPFFLTDEIWVILVVKEVTIPGNQSQNAILHHLTEVGELLLSICDTLHTSSVTRP